VAAYAVDFGLNMTAYTTPAGERFLINTASVSTETFTVMTHLLLAGINIHNYRASQHCCFWDD